MHRDVGELALDANAVIRATVLLLSPPTRCRAARMVGAKRMVAGNRGRARASLIAVLTCLALLGSGCSGGGSTNDGASNGPLSTGSDAESTGGADDSAVQTYGYGPKPAAGVTYQPDVVMVPAGPAAIRSASSDGMVWTLDRAAKGVGDLKVGSILVATGRAAGRVVALSDEGNSRVVTLGPVELTDIVRDGEIDFKQALNADSMSYQQVPDQPGALAEPTKSPVTTIASRSDERTVDLGLAPRGDDGVITVWGPPLQLNAAPSGDNLPPASKGSVTIPAGDYKIKPAYTANALSLDIDRDGSLKVGVHFAFAVSELSVDSAVSIKSSVIGGSRFVINGIKGLEVSLSAGAAGGDIDNEKIRIEVPVEVSIPVPPSPATAGLPLVVKIQFIYSVETAITGKNSTIFATGKYGLEGPIGLEGGNFLAPKFTVQQSIIDSLGGITLGPSGVVLAVKMKVQAGLGIPVASAGPFGSVTTSLGITNGSSLGASLTRCKGATLDMFVGGGVSISISTPVLDALKILLPAGTSIPNKKELSTNVLHRTQVVPDVPLCQGAADSSGSGGGAAPG